MRQSGMLCSRTSKQNRLVRRLCVLLVDCLDLHVFWRDDLWRGGHYVCAGVPSVIPLRPPFWNLYCTAYSGVHSNSIVSHTYILEYTPINTVARLEGTKLSQRKSKVLVAGGVEAGSLTADHRLNLGRAELTVAERGIMMVGIPIGTDCHGGMYSRGRISGAAENAGQDGGCTRQLPHHACVGIYRLMFPLCTLRRRSLPTLLKIRRVGADLHDRGERRSQGEAGEP